MCSTCSRAAVSAQDKKSIAVDVTLAPKDKTLTDQEIEAVSKKIIAEVKRVTGGEIRS